MTGVATLSAGCLDTASLFDNGNSSSLSDSQPTATPATKQPTVTPTNKQPTATPTNTQVAYTEWLPALTPVATVARQYSPGPLDPRYFLYVVDLSSFRHNRSSLSAAPNSYLYDSLLSKVDGATVTHYIATGYTSFRWRSIEIGDYDVSAVISTLREDGYTEYPSYNGFKIFKKPSDIADYERAAVSTAGVISGFGSPPLTHIIDAKRTPANRYVNQSNAFAALTTQLSTGDQIWLGVPGYDFLNHFPRGDGSSDRFGSSQVGGQLQLNGKTSRFTIVFYDTNDNDYGKEAIEASLNAVVPGSLLLSDLDVSWIGNVLRAEMTVSTKKITSIQ